MKYFFCSILLFLLAISAYAHEMRPGYLEIIQTAEEVYALTWKVPAKGPGEGLEIQVRLPEDCNPVSPLVSRYDAGAIIETSTITRVGGLEGSEIYIEGLSITFTDVLVRMERMDGSTQIARLTPDKPSVVLLSAPGSMEVAQTYTVLGIQHIWTGIDHLLFVLCLIIIAGISHKLVITITGFTLAHSITLALSTLGIVHVPQAPVEAVIALSIVFLATEIARRNTTSLTYRYPVAVSMSFGLLHGFGFAAVLGEIGLPQNEIPTALLFFNVGVELGQLLFIGGIFLVARIALMLWKMATLQPMLPALTQTLAAYLIGGVSTYWMIQRIAGF